MYLKKEKKRKWGGRKHAKIDCLPYYGNFFFLTKKKRGGGIQKKKKKKGVSLELQVGPTTAEAQPLIPLLFDLYMYTVYVGVDTPAQWAVQACIKNKEILPIFLFPFFFISFYYLVIYLFLFFFACCWTGDQQAYVCRSTLNCSAAHRNTIGNRRVA